MDDLTPSNVNELISHSSISNEQVSGLRLASEPPNQTPKAQLQNVALQGSINESTLQKAGRSSPRLIDDVLRLLSIKHPQSQENKILSLPPIEYSDKVSVSPQYQLWQFEPPLKFAPNLEIKSDGKVQIYRALLCDTKPQTSTFPKFFHVKIILTELNTILNPFERPIYDFHYVEKLKIDEPFVKLVADGDGDTEMELDQDLIDFYSKAYPDIIEEATFKCSITNAILEIYISKPEFQDQDLEEFEDMSIDLRYAKYLSKIDQKSDESSLNPKDRHLSATTYPTKSMCFHTLFKVLRNPLLQQIGSEKKTIAFDNLMLNIRLNPELLGRHLFIANTSNDEWVPPYFYELGTLEPIVRESFKRKIWETVGLIISSCAPNEHKPINNAFNDGILPLKQLLSCTDFLTAAPKKNFRLPLNNYEYSAYVKLGAVETFSDNLIIKSYELQAKNDEENIPIYADAIRDISQMRSSQNLQFFVVNLMSLGVLTKSEIDEAYRALNIDPIITENMTDEMIIDAYKLTSTINNSNNNNSNSSKETNLKGYLSTLANARKSKILNEYLNNESTSLTLQSAYEILNVDAIVDDDVIIIAYQVKQGDNPDEKTINERALVSIAETRKSSLLLDYVETNMILSSEPVSSQEAFAILDVDNTTDDLSLITVFQLRLEESPLNIRSLRHALRSIAIERSSSLLIKYLKTGKIDHNDLSAYEWPVGMNNIGNTCYLNSLLQYYFTIKPLRELLISFEDPNFSKRADLHDIKLNDRRIGGRKIGLNEVKRSQRFVIKLNALFNELTFSDQKFITPERELAYLAFVPTQSQLDATDNDEKKIEEIKVDEAHVKSNDNDEISQDTEMTDVTETNEDSDQGNDEKEKKFSDTNATNKRVLERSTEDESQSDSHKRRNSNDTKPMDIDISLTEDNEIQDGVMMVSSPPANDGDQAQKQEIYEPPKTQTNGQNLVASSNTLIAENTEVKSPNSKATEEMVREPSPEISPAEIDNALELGRQQDVTECIGNVLFQIESALKPDSFEEDGEQVDIVKDFFYGKTKQELIPLDGTKRGSKREKSERFLSLLVNVADHPQNIYDALDSYFQEDIVKLDDGEFKRNLTITHLPPILQVQIQRVGFDREKLIAVKNISPLPFPRSIYMDRYLDTNDEEILTKRSEIISFKVRIKMLKKRLEHLTDRSVNGIALRDNLVTTRQWLNSKDVVESGLKIKPETIHILEKQIETVNVQIGSIEDKIKALEQQVNSRFKEMENCKYNIFAVFIHRGEANYGHYWVYIRDFKTNIYRKYNDETITEVPEDEVIKSKEGDTATPYFLVYVKDGMETELLEPLKRVKQERVPVVKNHILDLTIDDDHEVSDKNSNISTPDIGSESPVAIEMKDVTPPLIDLSDDVETSI